MQENSVKKCCKMQACLVRCFEKKICLLAYLSPVVQLLVRLVIASVFWKSGLTKISDWSSTVALFSTEYKLPFLPPLLSAYMGTAVELGASVMLVFGLATRFAALMLLGMVAVIEYIYPGYMEHVYWALLLAIMLCHGAGALSLDFLIRRKYCANV